MDWRKKPGAGNLWSRRGCKKKPRISPRNGAGNQSYCVWPIRPILLISSPSHWLAEPIYTSCTPKLWGNYENGHRTRSRGRDWESYETIASNVLIRIRIIVRPSLALTVWWVPSTANVPLPITAGIPPSCTQKNSETRMRNSIGWGVPKKNTKREYSI